MSATDPEWTNLEVHSEEHDDFVLPSDDDDDDDREEKDGHIATTFSSALDGQMHHVHEYKRFLQNKSLPRVSSGRLTLTLNLKTGSVGVDPNTTFELLLDFLWDSFTRVGLPYVHPPLSILIGGVRIVRLNKPETLARGRRVNKLLKGELFAWVKGYNKVQKLSSKLLAQKNILASGCSYISDCSVNEEPILLHTIHYMQSLGEGIGCLLMCLLREFFSLPKDEQPYYKVNPRTGALVFVARPHLEKINKSKARKNNKSNGKSNLYYSPY